MAAGASCGLWWWCGRETTHDDGVIPLGGRGVDVALSSSDGCVAGLFGVCLAVVKHMTVCRALHAYIGGDLLQAGFRDRLLRNGVSKLGAIGEGEHVDRTGAAMATVL